MVKKKKKIDTAPKGGIDAEKTASKRVLKKNMQKLNK